VSSNFAFLQAEWPSLFAETVRAERNTIADPRAACFYARRSLELAVHWLYQAEPKLVAPYRDDLSALLFEPNFRSLVGPAIHTKMDVLRRQGNAAVHKTRPITPNDALPVMRELFHVMFWLARRYSTNPVADRQFDQTLIPRPVPASVRLQTQAELKTLGETLQARDAELARERESSATLTAELAELRAQVAAAKAANEARPDDHDYDEEQTRDLFIDLLLKEAGWSLDQPRDREFEVCGMPNKGTGFVDYVLWGDDGKPLAVVEAKRTKRDAAVRRQQAKLYADCLETTYGQRPVIFYTNGYETWLWDDVSYSPRQVQGFYVKDELALLIARRTSRKPLAELAIKAEIVERHYQHRAIRRIGEAFERACQREALVVMATGAGKTRTVIALVELMMRAGWVKRVLFLADRVALVNQATNAFRAHLPDAATVNLVTDKEADGRVYVSTYPTMMGLVNDTVDGQRRFGPGFFDLVVIDEAHRSVYQKYRTILDYFDGLLLGLTATPKDEVDHNTYGLFHLEDGVPTDAYGLDEAVAEGYLVPPRAVSVPLKFQREGIRYDDLSDQEKDQWDALEWDEDGDVPDAIGAEAVNTWLFNTDTVDKMLQTLMTQGHRVAGGDRLGKTIIFAKNNAHAEFIGQRFDRNYPEYKGAFARVVTHKTEYAQSLIDDFSVHDKAPHIAISVDMLDTGIDVPEVVNLVFFKIVRAKTKFWQMIGRGTRLCPELYGPGQDKQDFYVFDFCQNLEFFNQQLAGTEGSLTEPLSQRLFKARLDLAWRLDRAVAAGVVIEVDGTHSEAGLRQDLARDLRAVVEGMNVHNIVVRPHRRWVEQYAGADAWSTLTADATAEIAEHLSGLPSAVRDDDEAAKRFDLLLLRLQLAAFTGDPGVERLRSQVQAVAAALLEQTAIPVIKAQELPLRDAAGDEWWVDVTLPMLELLRRRVRGLVALIEKSKRVVVYTDFRDELGESAELQLAGVVVANNFERFRAKARVYLRENEDHVAIQKLRRNRQLTPSDLDELERLLLEAGIADQQDLDRASQESSGLGLFVRSLVGLDREAATAAFEDFLAGKALSANQLHFVNLVIAGLTESGVLEPGRLYDSPFTDVAPQGPDAMFASADVESLFSILVEVRAHAVPAPEMGSAS
jgi:type I restriction enzyme R subunit